MQRSYDQTRCRGHGGGTQRNSNRTRHNGNNGGGQRVPIKLDMIDVVVEHKKISIKLNVVEEDEEASPILKF